MQNSILDTVGTAGRRWVIGVAVAALATAGPVLAYESGPVAGGGSISGVVQFKGTPPAKTELEVNKDKKACALQPKFSRELVVGADGGVQYAVVSIAAISKGKPFEQAETVLDQKGCEYVPYVITVQTGKPVQIKNSDGILHNIHTYSEKNPPLNRAQPKFKKTITETFAEPEMVKLTCDVHGWMSGWLLVQDHPYAAVTDATGAFKLTDVPAGDYELKVWQEKLGETTQKVSVQPGADTVVTFELAEQ